MRNICPKGSALRGPKGVVGRAYPCPFGAPSGIYCGRGSPKGTSWRKVGRCPFGARAIYCPKGPRRGNDFPGSPLWGPSRCPEGAIAKRGMRSPLRAPKSGGQRRNYWQSQLTTKKRPPGFGLKAFSPRRQRRPVAFAPSGALWAYIV